MDRRSWVQIVVLYTGWRCHFGTLICCKNCNDVCLKRPKINEKEAGVSPFLKTFKNSFRSGFAKRHNSDRSKSASQPMI